MILVHDYLLVMRGAERVFAELCAIWPEAPIATLLYDEDGTEGRFAAREIHTSPAQRLGVRQQGFRRLLPVFPALAERLPVGGHSTIVSSSSAFGHGIRPDVGAVHVCYCHTPFRYAWHERDRALEEAPRALRKVLDLTLDRIARWDLAAARRVDRYVANSRITQDRIRETYGRESVVVHPPVEVDRFTPGRVQDRLLLVCELVAHKRVDLALRAAREAGHRIAVVGEGPELPRLRAAHPEAEFLGRVDDETLARLYSSALALVVPNVEEFGIAAVEAMAAGRPVVGPSAGGTSETVATGETGVLVEAEDEVELARALRETDFRAFDPLTCRARAEVFSPEAFRRRLREEVEAAVEAPAVASSPVASARR